MAIQRRKFNSEFKARVVLELLTGTKGLMQASREHGIKDTVISRWRQEFLERAPDMFKGNGWQNDQEIQQRLVGRLTLELDMVKKIIRVLGFSQAGKRLAMQAMNEMFAYPVKTG